MSSSDYLSRRRYLITEGSMPRPCCTDNAIYSITAGTTQDLSSDYVIVATATAMPTINSSIAILSGNLNVNNVVAGEEITMRLTYGLIGETVLLPTYSVTASAFGSISVAGINQTPVLTAGTTYIFNMEAKTDNPTTTAVSSTTSNLVVITNVRA
jgi:hypothetical protein